MRAVERAAARRPSGGAEGSPAAGAWCSRRGRCQGSAGGQWNPGAAVAAEAAVSAARPRPPAPLRRGPPEVSDSLPCECPLPCGGEGVPPTPSSTASPPPHLGSTTKLSSRWHPHSGFLHPFFPNLGSSSAFWLPLLFSSSPAGDSPSLTLIPVASVPNYLKSSSPSTSRCLL